MVVLLSFRPIVGRVPVPDVTLLCSIMSIAGYALRLNFKVENELHYYPSNHTTMTGMHFLIKIVIQRFFVDDGRKNCGSALH